MLPLLTLRAQKASAPFNIPQEFFIPLAVPPLAEEADDMRWNTNDDGIVFSFNHFSTFTSLILLITYTPLSL